ncbi:MAG: hypothetical protein HY706_00015 [Candidatus Hydrogenedentes bacterium]|nr:hypothetical protein [Candidatus Hydrogenedentota bacterium]
MPMVLIGALLMLPANLWALLHAIISNAPHSGEWWSERQVLNVWGIVGLSMLMWISRVIAECNEIRSQRAAVGSIDDRSRRHA